MLLQYSYDDLCCIYAVRTYLYFIVYSSYRLFIFIVIYLTNDITRHKK